MAIVKFHRCPKADMTGVAITDGQILVATDTGEIFFDIPINGALRRIVGGNIADPLVIRKPVSVAALYPVVEAAAVGDFSNSLTLSGLEAPNREFFTVYNGTSWIQLPDEGLVSGYNNAIVAVDMRPFVDDFEKKPYYVRFRWLLADGTPATAYKSTVFPACMAEAYDIDDTLSTTSTNPVQNKTVTVALETKIDDAPHDGKYYVRCNGAWVELPGVVPTETTYVYYGYIHQPGINSISAITADMILTLSKIDSNTAISGPLTTSAIPAGAMLVAAVPADYTASKDNGLGGRTAFYEDNGTEGTGSNGGTTISVNDITYSLYGEFRLSTAPAKIYIEQEA